MGKLDIIEENISKLEDIATEITQNKTEQKKNLMKKWLKTFPNLVKAILFFFHLIFCCQNLSWFLYIM